MWLFVTVALHAGLEPGRLVLFLKILWSDFPCFSGWGYGGLGVMSPFISAACYAGFA